MRFSVECAFPHLGKRRLTSRKSAFCPDGLTQKRILDSTPHAKAHSGGSEDPRVHLSVRTSYRMCFYVTHKGCRRSHNALFRRVRFSSPGQTWGRRSVHKLAKMTSQRRFGSFVYTIATASGCRMRFSSPALFLTCANVESPHEKPHSTPTVSRKSAFWTRPLTQKRILTVLKIPDCAFP